MCQKLESFLMKMMNNRHAVQKDDEMSIYSSSPFQEADLVYQISGKEEKGNAIM